MRSLRQLLARSTIAVVIVGSGFLGTTALVHQFWRSVISRTNGIQIVDATYGGNCEEFSPAPQNAGLVKHGNATASIMQSCENTDLLCPFVIDQLLLGDPAVGCNKDFEANWRCGRDPVVHQIKLQPEAKNKIAWLSCSERP